jgi:hypothetical protein
MNYGPFGYFDGLNATAPKNTMTMQMGNQFAGNMLGQGINTMNNLGANIGNAFAQANQQSGYNMAAKMPYEVERLRQQGASQRLQAMAPLLAALFGGGGAAGGMKNINTNYGAGVRYGS